MIQPDRSALPAPASIAVVIPHWGPIQPLDACLRALEAQSFTDFKLYLVDNSGSLRESPLPTTDNGKRISRLIQMGSNQGFAAACNAGWIAGDEPIVAFLNNDAIPDREWLASAQRFFEERSEIDFAQSLILRKDDRSVVDDAGDFLDRTGRPQARGRGGRLREFDEWILAPCGAAAFYRREALEEVGGFDESYFAYLEDVQLGIRMNLSGKRGALIAGSVVLHGSWGEESRFDQPRRVYWIHRNKVRLWLALFPATTLLRSAPMLGWGILRSAVFRLGSPVGFLALVLAHLTAPLAAPRLLTQRRALRGSAPGWGRRFDELWKKSVGALER